MEEEEIVRGAQVIGIVLRIIAACLVLAVVASGLWWWKRAA
jgi:hypothetical protein